ncbi:hypothetical protein Trydic_g9461 [Trypoxylus dichotomus]
MVTTIASPFTRLAANKIENLRVRWRLRERYRSVTKAPIGVIASKLNRAYDPVVLFTIPHILLDSLKNVRNLEPISTNKVNIRASLSEEVVAVEEVVEGEPSAASQERRKKNKKIPAARFGSLYSYNRQLAIPYLCRRRPHSTGHIWRCGISCEIRNCILPTKRDPSVRSAQRSSSFGNKDMRTA